MAALGAFAACESATEEPVAAGGTAPALGGGGGSGLASSGLGGQTLGGSGATLNTGGVKPVAGSSSGGSSPGPAMPGAGNAGSAGSAAGGNAPLGGSAALGGSANGGSPSAQGGAAGSMGGGAGGVAGQANTAGAAGNPVNCPSSPKTLKEAGACSGRLIGTAINTSHLSESAYVETLREHNYATAENEMKWDSLEPSRNNFSYGNADRFVNFAMQNGMQIKGHTLVWHLQLPGWISNMSDPAEVRAALTNHIKTIVSHYKDRIKVWDVVNEAFENPENWPDENTPAYRNSVFYRVLGKGFVDEAFKAAREADPDAKLVYNDFRSEGLQPKSNAVYEMVKSMVERGIPIDAVGLQTHLGTPNSKPPIADVIQNMQRIADLGLEVLISEMDSHCCDGETPEAQAVRFHDIVAACLNQPKCTAITFWGTTDKYSWLNTWDELDCGGRKPSGLLWDDDFKKKPAYQGVMDALLGR